MKKGLFQVLMFCATLLLTAQLSAQSFPSVAPPPGTTTYSSLAPLPADWDPGFGQILSYAYEANGSISFYADGGYKGTASPGQPLPTSTGTYIVPTPATLPSGYSYTPTGQILTPQGQTVSSFSVSGPEVPFDGGMSIMLLASGIGYGAKRLKAKKAAKATATAA